MSESAGRPRTPVDALAYTLRLGNPDSVQLDAADMLEQQQRELADCRASRDDWHKVADARSAELARIASHAERDAVGVAQTMKEVYATPFPAGPDALAEAIKEIELLATWKPEPTLAYRDVVNESVGKALRLLRSRPAQGDSRDAGRLDWLQSQLNYGWGDGFAMQLLDSGGQYVRPWRSAMQRIPGFELTSWWPTIREAIDAAMSQQEDGEVGNMGKM